MKSLLVLLCSALALPLSLQAADPSDEVAVIETSKGTVVVEFWKDAAPKTIENFKKLAKSGFYDGTAFHRIIGQFMAQGGDPLTKDLSKEDLWGTGDPGYKIPAEFNSHKHVRGVISMARSNDPDSAGSQFFLMFGPAPMLDGKYTTFGKLIQGEDTLAKIEATPVTMSRSGEPSKPTERVEIKSVKIVPAASLKN
ncbi:MAG TPA: peptidylprolyl isomerase [Terrimicrobiaceae bacterium]|nr:peptidylprolyl isomerase [Terrimicrobiaceae bacterium]